MSTRNYAADAGNVRTDGSGGLRGSIAVLREALSTKAARRLIFALQFLLSFCTLFYFRGVLRAAYYSCFYRLDIPEDQRKSYCILASLACVGYGILMIFTRRQIVTRAVILISMPFYLPIFLFNFRHLVLIIPLAVLIAVTYVASGVGEGTKTILGAVFLTFYLLGSFLFLFVQSILSPATTETVIERGVTPNAQFRYSVVQVEDQANGNTYVAIEPNTLDITGKHAVWYAKGYTREIYRERPLSKDFAVEWRTQTRAEITRELIATNPNITFTLDAKQMQLLGLDADYEKRYRLDELNRKQRLELGYALSSDLLGGMINGKTPVELGVIVQDADYTVTLTFAQMQEIGLEPTYEQRLSRMTDEHLALLGVPEQNEVLLVNGKVVFRQYVAVLERTYTVGARSLTAFMESNTLPPVVPGGVPIPETTAPVTTTTTQTTETTETTETTD